MKVFRINLLVSILLFWFGSTGQTCLFAETTRLDDNDLDQIYAQGFMMRLTLDVSSDLNTLRDQAILQASSPSLGGDPSVVMGQGLVAPEATRTTLGNLQDGISINGNAFQYTTSLFNVVATGDVAVGVNLFVFIGDLVNSSVNTESTNLSFANLFSDLQRQ